MNGDKKWSQNSKNIPPPHNVEKNVYINTSTRRTKVAEMDVTKLWKIWYLKVYSFQNSQTWHFVENESAN